MESTPGPRKRKRSDNLNVRAVNDGKVMQPTDSLVSIIGEGLVRDTASALELTRTLVNWLRLQGPAIPPLTLRHQLYALLGNRSLVDREIGQMILGHKLVQLQIDCDTYGLIDVDEYLKTVLRSMQDCCVPTATRVKFETALRLGQLDVSISRERLQQVCQLADGDISTLVRCGALATRDAHSLWLALPNAYVLARALSDGRRTLLAAIRRSKFHEVLLNELLEKKFIRNLSLGVRYCLLDVIGSDLVSSVQTTSGPMLRISK